MPLAELVLETCDLQCERNGREHRTAEMGSQQLVTKPGFSDVEENVIFP